nr:hypothetical protein B0A51_00118 [Rachicladosporium sp. CCFEE 5018]
MVATLRASHAANGSPSTLLDITTLASSSSATGADSTPRPLQTSSTISFTESKSTTSWDSDTYTPLTDGTASPAYSTRSSQSSTATCDDQSAIQSPRKLRVALTRDVAINGQKHSMTLATVRLEDLPAELLEDIYKPIIRESIGAMPGISRQYLLPNCKSMVEADRNEKLRRIERVLACAPSRLLHAVAQTCFFDLVTYDATIQASLSSHALREGCRDVASCCDRFIVEAMLASRSWSHGAR